MSKEKALGIRISFVTIVINVLLFLIKTIIGILGKSTAMIADGVHSLSDVLTTIGVIIGLKLSSKPDDKCHPYGHEKIESLASIFLGFLLLLVALGIGYSGIKTIISGNYNEPKSIAIFGAIISILVKEWMYWYTIKYAKVINSTSMKADAWHHRSDAISSVGALVGIIGARSGFPILDPMVSIIICIVIVKVAIYILKQSTHEIIDKSADERVIEKITKEILEIQGVERIDSIKTRIHVNTLYVDVEVSVNKDLTVEESHNIAIEIHREIEDNNNVKHCMVHINPFNPK
ncbi:cation diffusion facilitator family transporter [Clostridium hydrogeniformans]|uniref:cation diffusion facilitator family transporter n=1 Tax=Clostridium hydrogeniformans TaxID=349933 RepID=UPI0004848B08|nr:cation diffusion facilitator family transporter [Clostridium hydrogeniformans]